VRKARNVDGLAAAALVREDRGRRRAASMIVVAMRMRTRRSEEDSRVR
jgi:hypothetical protein